MNKVILSGNLTKDPESGQTNSGIGYCRFSVAVQRRSVNANGEREADFLNCTAWRKDAEFVSKYFKKGSKIIIVGSIRNNSYEGQDGQKKYYTDIVVDEVEFGEKKASGTDYAPSQGAPKASGASKLEQIEDDDDLPF